MRRAFWFCLLFLLLAGVLAAGQAGGTAGAADASQEEAPRPAPEEYGEEEFSRGLKALRRGEIIMLGSLPFSLFFTFEVFDLYRYAANDFDAAYSPWPFRRPGAAPYTREESIGVLVSALGVSLLVAVTDYMIGRIRDKRAETPSGPD